ncbi:hypothetical protein [Microbacterium sp. 22242]|uniref:hypothetical protein n=1 Tax=Microbacterium sp. 22242 TaxID=3453896 RepID=UPI003F8458A1
MEDSTQTPARALSRRTLVKGAAWSVPVIAVAAATPLAAASTGNASVAFAPAGQLLDLRLYDGTAVIASVLEVGPNVMNIINDAGPLSGPFDVDVITTYASGINFPLTDAGHGVGVATLGGLSALTWTENAGGSAGFGPNPWGVTSTFQISGPVNGNTTLPSNIGYKYTQNGTWVDALGVVASFSVTATVKQGVTTIGTAQGTVSVFLNAHVL